MSTIKTVKTILKRAGLGVALGRVTNDSKPNGHLWLPEHKPYEQVHIVCLVDKGETEFNPNEENVLQVVKL